MKDNSLDQGLLEAYEKGLEKRIRGGNRVSWLVAILGFLAVGFASHEIIKLKRILNYQEQITKEVQKKAEGDDRVFTYAEQVAMARALGYQGRIRKGIPITFGTPRDPCIEQIEKEYDVTERAGLFGSTTRRVRVPYWQHPVTITQFEEYLASK